MSHINVRSVEYPYTDMLLHYYSVFNLFERAVDRAAAVVAHSYETPEEETYEGHSNQNQTHTKVEKRVERLVLKDAIKNKSICSISMEPITMESICVFPCYHCFNKDSLVEWLSRADTCPECRQVCSM